MGLVEATESSSYFPTKEAAAEVLAAADRLVAEKMEEGRLYEAIRVNRSYVPVWRDPETKRPYLRRAEEDLFGERSKLLVVNESKIKQVVAINGAITQVHLQAPPKEEASSPTLGERLPSATRAHPGKFGAGARSTEARFDSRAPQRTLTEMIANHPPQRVVEDLEGYDERPDPLQASSDEEFLKALREYRVWAGKPSYRRMSSNCGQKVAYSTFCTALKGDRLPKLFVVQACIEACGGGHEDVQRWTTAWRRLRKQEAAAPVASSAGGHVAGQVFELIGHINRAHTGT